MRPAAKRNSAKSAPPMPIMIAPSIWLHGPLGLTTAPHSKASTTRLIWVSGYFEGRAPFACNFASGWHLNLYQREVWIGT